MARGLRGKSATGLALYAHILNASSQIWNGSAFEAYNTSDYQLYKIPVSEQGASGVYIAPFPPGIITVGTYDVVFYIQDGALPADGDHIAGTQSYSLGT